MFLFGIPFIDFIAIEQFVLQISIPIDTEVYRRTSVGIKHISSTIVDIAVGRRPKLETPACRVDIGSNTPTNIGTGKFPIYDFTRTGLMYVETIFYRFVFVGREHFQSIDIGVQIGEVDSIAMPHTGAV